MTCTAPEARITPGCTGLWNEAQSGGLAADRRFRASAFAGEDRLQLGHAGRKGSTQLGWEEMDQPLPAGNWPLLAASPLPYFAGVSQVPRAMTEDDGRG